VTTHAHRPALLLILPLVLAPLAHAHAAPGACETKAIALIDAMARHDYDTAKGHLDEHLRANSGQMGSMWESLVHDVWGPYRSHGEAQATLNGDGTTTIRLPLQFDHGETTTTITCNPKEGGAVDEFVLL
jgi:hypothetical protein